MCGDGHIARDREGEAPAASGEGGVEVVDHRAPFADAQCGGLPGRDAEVAAGEVHRDGRTGGGHRRPYLLFRQGLDHRVPGIRHRCVLPGRTPEDHGGQDGDGRPAAGTPEHGVHQPFLRMLWMVSVHLNCEVGVRTPRSFQATVVLRWELGPGSA